MKIKYLLVAALLIFNLSVKAQHQRIRTLIYDTVIPSDGTFLKEEQYKNGFVTFSFALSTNARGIVDSVKFSDTIDDRVKTFINFKEISHRLKSDKQSFTDYKNTLFFGMVLIANGDEGYLKPSKGLYPAWPNLLSNLSSMIKDRKLIILDPTIHLLYFDRSN